MTSWPRRFRQLCHGLQRMAGILADLNWRPSKANGPNTAVRAMPSAWVTGSDALELVLRAFEIGEGDEVITASNGFIATLLAISATGARPVLVEPNEETHTIDPGGSRRITSRTRAILPTHLYGHPADLRPYPRNSAATRDLADRGCRPGPWRTVQGPTDRRSRRRRLLELLSVEKLGCARRWRRSNVQRSLFGCSHRQLEITARRSGTFMNVRAKQPPRPDAGRGFESEIAVPRCVGRSPTGNCCCLCRGACRNSRAFLAKRLGVG